MILDGGPAFPTDPTYLTPGGDREWNDTRTQGNGGMTLRDYFAGQALPGVVARYECLVGAHAHIAGDCYDIADAMLKARGEA